MWIFFAASTQILGDMYAKTHEVFQACGINGGGGELSRSWMENKDTGKFIYWSKSVIPMKFHTSCEALWHLSLQPRQQEDRQDYFGVEDPDNTAAYMFRVTASLNSGSIVSVRQQSVTRRFKERGRLIVVWRSLMKGEGMFTGILSEETGWTKLTPLVSSLDKALS
ncbi:unnamed protein product [Phytophthora lilii]|uniref:Unnamed protein product n=1 Tax=Phytophthora lilii TaxID=2077276 RepID=A0A9W6X8B5_9STRA|nr:unnamed protein product [Phytophthora lilii]